jgi:Sulfotransferase family
MRDTDLFAHAGLAFGGEELEALADVPITEEQLLGLAEEMVGLSDWGDDQSFRLGLNMLIDSIEGMGVGPTHRHLFRRQLVHFLNQRLRLRADELRNPEIVEAPIERPLVIVGFPRTGTTVTHELLALDPAARAPLNWEYAAPWPAPERATFETDPRIARVEASWAAQKAASPELESMLPTHATMPSECNDSMMFHFAGPNYCSWWKVPAYQEWWASQTPPGLYRTHRRILQQLQWKGPRGRWTLKSPGFVGDLEAIVDAYPDACLIWTHRDPATSLVSLSSLINALRYALLGERTPPEEMAAETIRIWSRALLRGVEQRKNPRVAAAVFDVPYRELVADKQSWVERIYDHFGLELTDEHRARIEQFEQVEPSSHYAQHRYTTEEFGVDPDQIREQLAVYYDEYAELL